MRTSWFPTISSDKCDTCKGTYKCVNFCPHQVLEIREKKAFVINPLNCIYGCSTCADLCPKDAIIFPLKEKTSTSITKKSLLHRVLCKGCGKNFLTDRKTEYCFDCE